MQNQSVGPDHLHGRPTLVEAKAIIELHRTEVGQDRNGRCERAHLEAGGQSPVLEGFPLRAHSDRDTQLFSSRGETSINAGRDSVPPVMHEISSGARKS